MPNLKFTQKEKDQLAQEIINYVDTYNHLKDLSNEQIGELLFYHVWAYIDILSPQGCLVELAASRLGFQLPDEDDQENISPSPEMGEGTEG